MINSNAISRNEFYAELRSLLKDCCDSPRIVIGSMGGPLESYMKCGSCNHAVYGYSSQEMILLWNKLLDKKAIDPPVIDTSELPCMELTSR